MKELLYLSFFLILLNNTYADDISNEQIFHLNKADSVSVKEVFNINNSYYIAANTYDSSERKISALILKKYSDGFQLLPEFANYDISHISKCVMEDTLITIYTQIGKKDSLLPAVYQFGKDFSVIDFKKAVLNNGSFINEPSSFELTNDGGFIILNTVQSDVDYSWNMYSKIFNKDMELLSDTIYMEQKRNLNEYKVNFIHQKPDSTFLVYTTQTFGESISLVLNKLDRNGAMILYYSTPHKYLIEKNILHSAAMLSDNNFIMSTSEFYPDIMQEESTINIIKKVDTAYNIIWEASRGDVNVVSIGKILEKPDGNILLAGNSHNIHHLFNDSTYKFYLAEYTSDGSLLYEKVWGDSINNKLHTILRISDNKYIIAGECGSNYSTNIYFAEFSGTNNINEKDVNKNKPLFYPNPAKEYIILSNSIFVKHIQIYSTIGELIYETPNKDGINIDFLTPGCYFVRLNTGEQVLTEKLIVTE